MLEERLFGEEVSYFALCDGKVLVTDPGSPRGDARLGLAGRLDLAGGLGLAGGLVHPTRMRQRGGSP